MLKIFLFLTVLFSFAHLQDTSFLVGTGIYDITGPAAEANFMGMGDISQMAHGIQLRLFSRANIFVDPVTNVRVAYVSADMAFVPGSITNGVISKLQSHFNSNIYTQQNVMISATHTHSGPGGYSTYTLYDVTSFGFIQKNWECIVNGIATSIINAHNNIQPANLKITNSTLLNTSANRSPYSYTYDPEASYYPYNTDKNITVLRIEDAKGTPFSLISWFAVHGTSMNNTNKLISGDNKGFASWYIERMMNPDTLPGQNSFVASFGQCNEGDVSPNIEGAKCRNGSACDFIHSTCDGRSEGCYAYGPGADGDMTESCQIIGMNQAQKTIEMFQNANNPITGSVDFRHTYIDFENVVVSSQFSSTGQQETTCTAALGDSFAAGTTDGPGALNFIQGTNATSENRNPIWNTITDILSRPTKEQKDCQYPKPILFNTGGIKFPGDSPWTPSVIPLQLFKIGNLYIIGVPGEFTSCSGRRLRKVVKATLEKYGVADENAYYIIGGLSNEYTHYIATPEEYIVQRYEAASTLYGQQTLPAYLQEFTNIAKSLATNSTLSAGPTPPPANFTTRLFPEWKKDSHPIGKKFGHVENNVNSNYNAGDLVSVEFIGANPRNNYKTNSSFLTVEELQNDNSWKVIFTDADFNTIFRWKRHLVDQSHITIEWQTTSSTPSGSYRIQYYGDSIDDGTITPFTGTSKTFNVTNNNVSRNNLGHGALLHDMYNWWKALEIEI
eukprot:TRINITY_DN1666_c0_g1_i1.p1 TRINITY_DN1666_c0_g1~~TRINITY_DN1666_c0_g1_i1.p1  ORF type:complete len:727 (-),score=281.42 TRINITY_DN1666_c0_g1_i1:239-2419(-)